MRPNCLKLQIIIIKNHKIYKTQAMLMINVCNTAVGPPP